MSTALEVAGRAYARSVEQAETRRQRLAEAIRTAAANGLSEYEISRQANVSRMTVRKALGK